MTLKKRISHFIFPPLCLHCQESISVGFFCQGCAIYFEPMDPCNRCRYCFSEIERGNSCRGCREKKKWHYQVAAVFEPRGAFYTFYTALKNGTMPYLAKTAAQFILLQLIALKWEPECIFIFPRKWHQRLFRGRFHLALVAKEVAKIMEIPLYRKMGSKMEDKKILVLGDTMEGEKRMEEILHFAPHKAYFLALMDEREVFSRT